MNKRKVTFSNLITLIKNRRPHSIFGIVFMFLAVFILLPSIISLTHASKEDFESYDFEEIEQKGTARTAKIMDISTVYNMTINEEHPVLITYEFVIDGITKTDKFKTLDLVKINGKGPGSEIKIKTFENESKIQGLSPVSFPIYIFYFLPLVFFVLGSVFSVIGLVPVFKDYNLYKNGIVREGTIISFTQDPPSLLKNFGQSILINYYYLGSDGEKIFAKDKIADYSIMMEKKAEDKIKIFVSETDGTKSCIVPKLGAMKNNWVI
jgi:hypothetical protein